MWETEPWLWKYITHLEKKTCVLCRPNCYDIGQLNTNNKKKLTLRKVQRNTHTEKERIGKWLLYSLQIFFNVRRFLDNGRKTWKLYFEALVVKLRSLHFTFKLPCVCCWWEPAAQEGQLQPEDMTENYIRERMQVPTAPPASPAPAEPYLCSRDVGIALGNRLQIHSPALHVMLRASSSLAIRKARDKEMSEVSSQPRARYF